MNGTIVDDKYEYKKIGETNEQYILQVNLLIKNQKYQYFMIVPKINSMLQILLCFRKNGISDYADFARLDNIAVVIPVLSDAMSNYMASQQTDGYMAGINYFYKILGNSALVLRDIQKGTNANVLVNNSEDYPNFIDSFVFDAKSRGRGITCKKTDTDLLKKEVVQSVVNQPSNFQDTSMDIPLAYPNPSEELFQEETKGMTKKLTKKSEPGFVSYVLLGVVIAVASLIFLYMIL